MKRVLLICLLALTPVVSFAQEQTPASIQVLQNMVGQLAGQNAMLVEQVQKLTSENVSLKQQLASSGEKKPAEAPSKK